MERSALERDLAQTRRHVALGERHLRRQRALIARLNWLGRDATAADDFLALLLSTQASHEEHRDRLIKELSR
jgi:hypothetical protein